MPWAWPKRTQVVGRSRPARSAAAAAKAGPATKKPWSTFARKKGICPLAPQVLQDYIEHGLKTTPANGAGFDRAVETAIYNTLPHNLGRLLSTHPSAALWPHRRARF